jgi:hypothetical protein
MNRNCQVARLFSINIIGGIAVLGSYAWGLSTHTNASTLLWGEVPVWIRPFYTLGMLMAALGYFGFTYYIFFHLDPHQTRLFGRFRYSAFSIIYTAILLPSACWMPLTFLAIDTANLYLYWLVHIILIIVAFASISLMIGLLSLFPRQPVRSYYVAVIGSIFFCLQTALPDAAIWGSFFQLP